MTTEQIVQIVKCDFCRDVLRDALASDTLLDLVAAEQAAGRTYGKLAEQALQLHELRKVGLA